MHATKPLRAGIARQRLIGGGASESRHIVGDAIDFYCLGLTDHQVYWALDPWCSGGLGRYSRFPSLVHIDARGYKARWTH